MRRPLCGHELSHPSYGARIYLLHVEDLTPPVMYRAHVQDYETDHFEHDAIAEVRKHLGDFVKEKVMPLLEPASVRIDPVVRIGKPVDGILAFTREEQIDVIVMATHGRTGFMHILMGSVAEQVVRRAEVPVLTVKPPSLRKEVMVESDVERDLHIR
jgi:nucleotide-binding universal stress UspA family protein